MHTAYLGIGSNIDQKLKNCQKGIDLFIKLSDSKLKACSNFYKTDPLYVEDQDWFVNGVFKIKTDLLPSDILKHAKEIEKKAGRDFSTQRYGPRVLDLDILFYDDIVINTDGLVVPHPKMHERRFVLQPLCDIEADIEHPVLKKTTRQLLKELDNNHKKAIRLISGNH